MNPAVRLTAQSGRKSAKNPAKVVLKPTPVVETISIEQFLKPKKQPEVEQLPAPTIVPITSYSTTAPDTAVLSSALKDEILLNESLKARLRAWEQQPNAVAVRDTRLERVEALLAENRSLRNWGEGLQADLEHSRHKITDLQHQVAQLAEEAASLSTQLSDEKHHKLGLEKKLVEAESKIQELAFRVDHRPTTLPNDVVEDKKIEETELATANQNPTHTAGLIKTLGYVYQILQSCLAKLGGNHLVTIPSKALNLQVLLLEIRSLSISLNSEVELAEGKRNTLEKKYLTASSKLHDAEELALRLNKAVEESQTDLRAEIERSAILEAKLAELEEEWQNLSNKPPTTGKILNVNTSQDKTVLGAESQPYIEHLEQALALQEHLNGLHKQVLARVVDCLHPTIGAAIDLFLRANTDLIMLGDEHPFGVDEQLVSARANETLEEWKSRFEAEKSKRIHQSLQKGTLNGAVEEANSELEQALDKIRSQQKLEPSDFTDLQQDVLGDPSAAVNPYLSDSLKHVRPGASCENNRTGRSPQQVDFNRLTPASEHGSGRGKSLIDSGTDFSDIKTKLRIIKSSDLRADD